MVWPRFGIRQRLIMRLGQKASPETIEKLRLSHLGHHHTEESKQKIREHSPHLGHPELSPFYGKHLSKEHRENMDGSYTFLTKHK